MASHGDECALHAFTGVHGTGIRLAGVWQPESVGRAVVLAQRVIKPRPACRAHQIYIYYRKNKWEVAHI